MSVFKNERRNQMAKRKLGLLEIEDADIGYRNFRGAEGLYNKEGDRNFSIFLDPVMADELAKDGWNIKYPKKRADIDQEEDQRRPYLTVAVNYGNVPPKIVMIAGESVTVLKEDQLAILDSAELEHVDLVINPYEWSTAVGSGVKAYLKAMYVTLVVDKFIDKYGV